MYQFPSEPNLKLYWRCDKMIIKTKLWAKSSKDTKACYVPIAIHCDSKGVSIPSQRRIAIQAGITPKTARKGINEGWPLINFKPYQSRNGNKGKEYHLKVCPDEKGRSFPIDKWLVETGIWSQLRPGSKALYIAMKGLAYFGSEGAELYSIIEDLNYGDYNLQGMIDDEEYQIRKYDFLDKTHTELMTYSGVKKNTIRPSLEQLKEYGLIEKIGFIDEYKTRNMYKIFRRPMIKLAVDSLNAYNAKRYRRKGG